MLDMLGICPSCGMPVYDSSEWEYDNGGDEYWHESCLPKSDKGIE